MESELVATTREDDGAEDAMAELLCPICCDLLHRPHRLNPCLHLFCDPCLRRLAVARIHKCICFGTFKCPICRSPIHKCPICRSPINDCHLDQELHDFIEDQYQDVYIQRQQAEMNSGIFNEPLPPMRRTLLEIFNQWQEEWLTPDLLLIAMVTLVVLMQVGIILLLNLIYDHGEEYLVVPSLRPIMRVLTIAKLILRLIAMIIQQWLRSLAVPAGEDETQEPQI